MSFCLIISTKIPTEKFDKFCFRMGRAEFVNFFVGILVETMTPKGHFEINWPLDRLQELCWAFCPNIKKSLIHLSNPNSKFLYSFYLGLAKHISATCPVTGSKKERLKHPCCKCGKVFSGKHRLEAHFKSVHLNEKPSYQCVPCGKYFVDPHQLKVA